MPSAPVPQVEVEQHHASLRVADLAAAIEYYTTRLGFVHAFSWGEPRTMAGVNIGETQIFLQTGEPAPQGCSLFFVIGDARSRAGRRSDTTRALPRGGARGAGLTQGDECGQLHRGDVAAHVRAAR